jgi:hypothetical protein
MIQRFIQKNIISWLFQGKIIIIYGPRQSGKTTLARHILESFGDDGVYFNCEVESTRQALSVAEPARIQAYFGSKKIVVLDEAQSIENIGRILKVFHDEYPSIQIIATGSSSFDLANKINEPLTGRSIEYILPPLSIAEVVATQGLAEYRAREDAVFRYGLYPGVFNLRDDEKKAYDVLEQITRNYLYKDILTLEDIRNPKLLDTLLRHLAFRIGSEISLNQLSNELGVAVQTVDRYLDLLEKVFVVRRIYAFSRNIPNEIKKPFKVYFVDIGIRNIFALNTHPTELRDDIGQIFENIFVIERWKNIISKRGPIKQYIWRTYDGKEIDLIEESENGIQGFECKWKKGEIKKSTERTFLEKYPSAKLVTVNKNNYLDFL